MSPDTIFTYQKDGVEVVGKTDKVAIKKNGLTIELTYEMVADLADAMHRAAAQLEHQNRQRFNDLFGRQEP